MTHRHMSISYAPDLVDVLFHSARILRDSIERIDEDPILRPPVPEDHRRPNNRILVDDVLC